jgi:glyoxylase-like metal-dependent hydrolase (beta-lactamase superfamily II)
VVDPGPQDEDHLRRVLAEAVAGDRRIARILLTHGHLDHSAGAARLAELSGAQVQAADPAGRLGAEGLADGDVITAAGCELRVVATPGHTADSVSLLLPADGALFTGDTVLGRGTTVIAQDGNLADYLRSLDQLRALAEAAELRLLLPGHGPMLADPIGTLDYYLAHRAERLDQVRSALAAGAKTPAEIVAMIYTDVDQRLWPAAELRLLLPGHGPMLADPIGTLDYYLAHRAERLDQVRSALAAGAKTPAEIVAMIYTDVDQRLWPAAEWSVRAQLDYLAEAEP